MAERIPATPRRFERDREVDGMVAEALAARELENSRQPYVPPRKQVDVVPVASLKNRYYLGRRLRPPSLDANI
jgi:hypothetical protein